MASAIDATLPVQGNPTTASVRSNFAAAKAEIEALQATAGVGPQGPIGNTGPSGTLTVGTVTTGAAGTNATVTNSGTTQAAVLNFTLPRGDSGTGGSGITETQAKDAVRQGNVQFLESPETTAVTFPTTPNAAGAPVVGTGWTPTTGGTATQAYTHNIGSSNPLAYPASISAGTFYQIVFSMTNVPATTTSYAGFFSIYFRTAPTATTGEQIVISNVMTGTTVTIQATSNFSHVVVVPDSGWQGTFTMTRVVAFTGAQNSIALRVKDWNIRARATSLYIGSAGALATGSGNVSLGVGGTLAVLTSGTNNVAVGFEALPRLTAGGSNVAIGYQSLPYLISADNNIGIGSYCGAYLVTGGYNIGLGYSAVYSYKGPGQSNNIGIGDYTQYYGSNSSRYNICIGMWVGFRGTGNIGIGYKALAYQSGPPGELLGSNNVGLGYEAGSYFGTDFSYHTAAENSIFLGANTKAAGDAQTNQIVIGYNALGHGSHTITLGNNSITALHCQVQSISALSDSRVKEDIQPADLSKCLEAVKNLPVSRWAWQPIAGVRSDKHVTGFMADDVAKVWPKAVTKENTHLTVWGTDGKPEMTSITDPAWKPEDGNGPTRAATTRQVEKTTEFKDLQYVSLTEALPTLWGAVQKLIEKNEALEKQLSDLKPSGESAQPSEPKPSAESKSSEGGGILRRRR